MIFEDSMFLNGTEYKIVSKITSNSVNNNVILKEILQLKYIPNGSCKINHIPGELQELLENFLNKDNNFCQDNLHMYRERLVKKIVSDVAKHNEEWKDAFF